MDEKLKEAKKCFFEHDYKNARNAFVKLGFSYEAGLSSLLLRETTAARVFFKLKEEVCPASSFGLIILDILENKRPKEPKYFQVRSFLEIYLGLMIENGMFDWAQKIIDEYEFFTKINLEVPKFIARVLNANGYNKTVHSFAKLAKKICFNDAEIHYIDACLYIDEGDLKNAKKCIEDCMTFAPEYYPIIFLKEHVV